MTVNQMATLKEVYEIAKIKSKKFDKDVAEEYLTQGATMLSQVINGKATSAPVLKGIIQFIHDVDSSLVPSEYRHLVQDTAMEMIGEDS